MSIWDRFKRMADIASAVHDTYAFIDVEVGTRDRKIHDIGASRYDGASYHNPSKQDLLEFMRGVRFICGPIVKTRRTEKAVLLPELVLTRSNQTEKTVNL